MNSKSLKDYFHRIGYNASASANLDNLISLHRHHICAIPFENLNPLLGLPVKLDLESIMQKLVYGGRGGYCFENNLLFSDVLVTLGFEVTGLEARVIASAEEIHTVRRTHMVLLVKVDGVPYTVDVGFGGLNPAIPLIFQPGIEQPAVFETYRFIEEKGIYTLQVKVRNEWKFMYTFDLQEQSQIDYELANWYVSTCPDSHFKKNLVVSIRAKDSRFTLNNNIFSTYILNEDVKREALSSVVEIKTALTTIFGINLARLPNPDAKLERLLEVS